MNERTTIRGALAMVLGSTPACVELEGRPAELEQTEPRIAAPDEAWCTVVVDGWGALDMETDYLPHVITCENGGADLEALKAQAIAARSVAYYEMATTGSICDSQGCQVYSCGVAASALAHEAVQATAGQYLAYDDMLTYGFYVAGDAWTSAPSCVGDSFDTEVYVTYNEGLAGADVVQTELGFVGPPGFGQNRGCMSQWGARCLEEVGYGHLDILRFYYGDDIEVRTAQGECVGDEGDECPFGDGLYCGGNGIDGDPLQLYACEAGEIEVVKSCKLGCKRRPIGEDDACKKGTVCPYGNGDYCGGNGVGGNPDTLYHCSAGTLTVAEACTDGCTRMPAGFDDVCG